jgi:hypothetical protein
MAGFSVIIYIRLHEFSIKISPEERNRECTADENTSVIKHGEVVTNEITFLPKMNVDGDFVETASGEYSLTITFPSIEDKEKSIPVITQTIKVTSQSEMD